VACPRTGGAAQDIHVTPGYGPSTTQLDDLPGIENYGDSLWKWLCFSQGLARDDDSDGLKICPVLFLEKKVLDAGHWS